MSYKFIYLNQEVKLLRARIYLARVPLWEEQAKSTKVLKPRPFCCYATVLIMTHFTASVHRICPC